MRLNREKRYQIKALIDAGIKQKNIVKQVGITPGALTKELQKNGGREKYDPDKADNRANKLARKSYVHYKFSDEVWAETEAMNEALSRTEEAPFLGKSALINVQRLSKRKAVSGILRST